MINERWLVLLTTNPVATWYIKHIASRIDPIISKATNGRYTSMGRAVEEMPMLTLTAIGRQSGKPRSIQLACVKHEGEYLIVASAMGQKKHPAWRYNIEANPIVQVQICGEAFEAEAVRLNETEKNSVWDKILATIPQISVYQTRTDRNICVFRLPRTKQGNGEIT